MRDEPCGCSGVTKRGSMDPQTHDSASRWACQCARVNLVKTLPGHIVLQNHKVHSICVLISAHPYFKRHVKLALCLCFFMYKSHHDCTSCSSPFPSNASGKYVCGTEGSAFLPLLVVCSAMGGGSGDSMIHLTSTLEVVRGWQSCRRRRRDSVAVCE